MNIAPALNRIIQWLHQHPVVNAVLVIGYATLLIFMHGTLVDVSVWIQNQLTFEVYNKTVEKLYVVFLLLLAMFLGLQFKLHRKHHPLKLTYLVGTVGLIILHSRYMFDSNIEVIHSFEFTFLAFLIFPFTKRFGATIFFTLPFMLIDEWYQYTILYPYLDYLDLNDIMMDTYGCGLAMTALFIAGVHPEDTTDHSGKPKISFWKRPEVVALFVLVALILIAVKLCLIAPYAFDKCDHTWLIINKRNEVEPFLRQHPTFKTMYHVMQPLEALRNITALHLAYFGLDVFRKRS